MKMVCQKSWYKYVKEKVQKNWEIGLDSRIQSQKKKNQIRRGKDFELCSLKTRSLWGVGMKYIFTHDYLYKLNSLVLPYLFLPLIPSPMVCKRVHTKQRVDWYIHRHTFTIRAGLWSGPPCRKGVWISALRKGHYKLVKKRINF